MFEAWEVREHLDFEEGREAEAMSELPQSYMGSGGGSACRSWFRWQRRCES